jgi:hypothetical protein
VGQGPGKRHGVGKRFRPGGSGRPAWRRRRTRPARPPR